MPQATAGIHFHRGRDTSISRIDQRVRLGAVEEWKIRNTDEHDDHMFHI